MFSKGFRSPDCDFERVGCGGVGADMDDVLPRLRQTAAPVLDAVRVLDDVARWGVDGEAGAGAGREVNRHRLAAHRAKVVLVCGAEPDGVFDDGCRAGARELELLRKIAVSPATLDGGG